MTVPGPAVAASRGPDRWRLLWPVLGAAVVVGLSLGRPTALAHLDGRVYDALLRRASGGPASERVAIVDVDERSLARFGRWPWPRSRIARMLGRVQALGAVAVGVDMMFPEPDESEGPAGDAAAELSPGDAGFAQTLAGGPFALGYAFTFGSREGRPGCVLQPLAATRLDESGGDGGPFRASGVICSLPALARAAGASGFLNASPDADGIVRRLPVVIGYEGALYPSLALATFARATAPRQVILRTTGRGSASLTLDGLSVPLDTGATLLLRFRGGKGTFRSLSAGDVLEDRVPEGSLRDHLVVVGTSALGLHDTVGTPVDMTLSGMELHATVLDNLVRRDFVRRVPAAVLVEVSGGVVANAGAALAVEWAGIVGGGFAVAGTAALLWVGAGWLLATLGTFVSPLLPLVGLAVGFVAVTLGRYRGERRRADRATRDLRQARELVLHALTSLTETRDSETGAHLLRTRRYMRTLCDTLARTSRFRDQLTPEVTDLLVQLAPIHDIGKVGVADRTLRKPGPLTDAEQSEMREHPTLGRDVIANAERRVGLVDDVFLTLAKDIVYAHHERWDGTGYPEGLKAEAIPLAGRLVAVVDVYDALISRRVYKDGLVHEEVVRAIAAGRGTQFDPDVVDGLLAVHEEWRQIARELADMGSDRTHP